MRKLFVLAIALALASPLFAAPNIAQNTQKGSVLVFPDIDIRVNPAAQVPINMQTIVRLQNDGPRDVNVKCYYLDGFKHRVDMQFLLTANQPFWFDVKTGDGTEHVTPYPNTPSNGFPAPRNFPLGAGLLACWVVDVEAIDQLKWNHLSGTATVINHANGSAYEYSAYAFYAPTGSDLQPVGTGGSINLDSVQYDSCPLYMIGQFSPEGSTLADVTFNRTRVVFTGCNLALNQDWTPTWTKLVFDVWNEEENKVTGAWECADTWHEIYLTKGPSGYEFPWPDSASSNFSVDALGTFAARYRVQGQASTQCRSIVGANAVAVGVLAIQSTDLELGAAGLRSLIGTNLTAAGKLPTGKIVWDPGFATPEGGIR